MLGWRHENEWAEAMKVDGPGPLRPANVRRPDKKRGQGASFAAEIATEEGAPAAKVAGAGPLAAVDAVLALQEVPDATTPRGRTIKRGRVLLGHLEEILGGLLDGAIPAARLTGLRQALAQERESQDDPQLTTIIQEIELRAAVELAKLERAPRPL